MPRAEHPDCVGFEERSLPRILQLQVLTGVGSRPEDRPLATKVYDREGGSTLLVIDESLMQSRSPTRSFPYVEHHLSLPNYMGSVPG